MKPFRVFWRRVSDALLSVNVRWKIIGIALGVVGLFSTTTMLFLLLSLKPILSDELRGRALSLARDTATKSADLLLVNDLFSLHELLRETVAYNQDVRYVFILDPQGAVVVDTFGSTFPRNLLDANPLEGGKPFAWVPLRSNEGKLYDVAIPLFEGRLGTLRLGVSELRLRRQLAQIAWTLLLLTGVASLAGVGAAYLLTYILTRPVVALMKATFAVQEGDFSQQVPIFTSDEFGQLGKAFNAMTKKLETAEIQRRALMKRILSVQEEERARVARELHDQTGQSLSSLLIRLKGIETASSLEDVRHQTEELRSLVAEALSDVRELAFLMHPSILDDLGLAAALKKDASTFLERFRLNVDCHLAAIEKERLPLDIEVTLYRIIHEALTNAARHAQAENVSILVQRREGVVLAIVEDDGKGFDLAAVQSVEVNRRFGLLSMEERAQLVGGRLTVESSIGRGTTVFVEIPLEGHRHAHSPSSRG